MITKDFASQKYQELFGTINKQAGYSLKVVAVKSGVLCIKYYSRNDFHCEEEDKVLFANNGSVFRNNKKVASFELPIAIKHSLYGRS